MLSLVRAILALSLGIFVGCNDEVGSRMAPEAVEPKEVIALFDGRSLTGWTTWLVDSGREDPRQVYTVENGAIRISGDGFGYLGTEQTYRNYRLVVEYKWGSRNWGNRVGMARDSGIFLHSVGPDGNSFSKGWGVEELNDGPNVSKGAFMAALECQVMEGETGGFIVLDGRYGDGTPVPVTMDVRVRRDDGQPPKYDEQGILETFSGGYIRWSGRDETWKDVFGFRGSADVESPAGEWTRVECICKEDTISVYVNGQKVNEAQAIFPRAGRILLQCEGSEIFFRKVELHPL